MAMFIPVIKHSIGNATFKTKIKSHILYLYYYCSSLLIIVMKTNAFKSLKFIEKYFYIKTFPASSSHLSKCNQLYMTVINYIIFIMQKLYSKVNFYNPPHIILEY